MEERKRGVVEKLHPAHCIENLDDQEEEGRGQRQRRRRRRERKEESRRSWER